MFSGRNHCNIKGRDYGFCISHMKSGFPQAFRLINVLNSANSSINKEALRR